MNHYATFILLAGCIHCACTAKAPRDGVSPEAAAQKDDEKLRADLTELCAHDEPNWITTVHARFGVTTHGQVLNLMKDITREKTSKFTRILQLRDTVARHGLERCALLNTMTSSTIAMPPMRYWPYRRDHSTTAFEVDAKEGLAGEKRQQGAKPEALHMKQPDQKKTVTAGSRPLAFPAPTVTPQPGKQKEGAADEPATTRPIRGRLKVLELTAVDASAEYRQSLELALSTHMRGLRSCYEQALVKQPELTGQADYRLMIDHRGRPGTIEQERLTMMPTPLSPFGQCMTAHLNLLKLPSPPRPPLILKIGLAFTARDEVNAAGSTSNATPVVEQP
ncbi:MAG: hypothetical protein VX589_04415 [Myxococcota bacterium]|nr:hypothetical protein [Myxococcota bacterium]